MRKELTMSDINGITSPLILWCDVHARHYVEGEQDHSKCGEDGDGFMLNCGNHCGGTRCVMHGLQNATNKRKAKQ